MESTIVMSFHLPGLLARQVPGNPCRSLAMYFAADRKIVPGSLLDKFANGDDSFRNRRFKLIPSIETVGACSPLAHVTLKKIDALDPGQTVFF